jgi:hypothetical protein
MSLFSSLTPAREQEKVESYVRRRSATKKKQKNFISKHSVAVAFGVVHNLFPEYDNWRLVNSKTS